MSKKLIVAAFMVGLVAFTAVPGAAASPGVKFRTTPLLIPEGGTEPAISIAADGSMAITALNQSYPLEFSYTNLWTGSFGSAPALQGPIDARIEGSYGGADADVDIGSTGTLHVTTLVSIPNPNLSQSQLGVSSISCPGGDTSDHYAHCTSQLIDTTQTDRPFITSDGPEVYVVYHDSGNSAGIRVQRSDDDGVTWKRVGDVTMGLGQVTAGSTFNNDIGPVAVDPRTHRVYALFSSGTTGLNKAQPPIVHGKLYVAYSDDRGAHWTDSLVYDAPYPTNFSNPFPGGLAVDPTTGNVFAAASDTHSVYYARSTDGGVTWSTPTVLNTPPVRSTVFPAVAAYGGVVDVVYYGTPATSNLDPAAVWNVYMSKSTDGGVHFTQSQVTSSPNHVGPVCTDGDQCFAGDRTLAEVFEVAIDPQTKRAAVIYATDTVGDPLSITSGANRGSYLAKEATFTRSVLLLPNAKMVGNTTYVGLACAGASVPPAVRSNPATPQIAVAMRGTCSFAEKAQTLLGAGYDGFIVFNTIDPTYLRNGESVLSMFSGTYVDVPGEFVAHSTGLKIFGAASDDNLVVGMPGAPISVGRLRVQVALAQEG